jgi:hypothetical protein
MLVAVSLTAQSPKGWMVRADRSTSASDPDGAGAIKFVTMGTGFHATNPQAAVYWNPANTQTGAYTVKGTFTLMKPSGHTNYYGLVFGGSDLGGAKQAYTYFLVAQDGTWLIKKREGDASTRDVAPKTPNAAVKTPDQTGKSTNALEVRIGADRVEADAFDPIGRGKVLAVLFLPRPGAWWFVDPGFRPIGIGIEGGAFAHATALP